MRILFVCHGNICRSPMAEYLLNDLAEKRGLREQVFAESAATSTEEIGNPVHHGTQKILNRLGISCREKRAIQMTASDYERYDWIIGMDQWNLRNILRITGGDPQKKIFRFLDLTDTPRDIADPWYTGNFEETYQDILQGCEALLNKYFSKGENKIDI
ncbi:MAG: low molecular weight protein-tyrosine-phosphatase [Candidatus Merdivicinus sp.]|jgi:protein-tyrosine phosphatase